MLPAFVFLHTLAPLPIPGGGPASLVVITAISVFVGKTIGIGGTLFVVHRRFEIHPSEALAVGLASAAALTVALIGLSATLKGTEYEQVASLGILAATAIAVILGITVGRLRRESTR